MSIRKKKHHITCYSEAEMNHLADSLIEQGKRVEREVRLPLIQNCLMNPTYHVVYWEQSKAS